MFIQKGLRIPFLSCTTLEMVAQHFLGRFLNYPFHSFLFPLDQRWFSPPRRRAQVFLALGRIPRLSSLHRTQERTGPKYPPSSGRVARTLEPRLPRSRPSLTPGPNLGNRRFRPYRQGVPCFADCPGRLGTIQSQCLFHRSVWPGKKWNRQKNHRLDSYNLMQ